MSRFTDMMSKRLELQRRDEQQRHATKLAELDAQDAVLQEARGRTRLQVFRDRNASAELLEATFENDRGPFSPAEVRALLTRPYEATWAAKIRDDLAIASKPWNLPREGKRLQGITDALVEVEGWPAVERVKVACAGSPAYLGERAAREPAVALLLGMHATPASWGGSTQNTTAIQVLQRVCAGSLWFELGCQMDAGALPSEEETPLWSKLLKIQPLDVAVRIAASMPPLPGSDADALRTRVDELFDLVAAVVAEAA